MLFFIFLVHYFLHTIRLSSLETLTIKTYLMVVKLIIDAVIQLCKVSELEDVFVGI